MKGYEIPRLVIAGLSGDSGKTLVSLSIVFGLLQKGLVVAPFKKGPDYIDAAWLGEIAHRKCRNLDTFLVKSDDVLKGFLTHSIQSDIAVIEGNRGIFDGRDVPGTHSTATLARLIQSPVILVIDVTKVTRTVVAIINGCISFEPALQIAGVILNKVAGSRHQKILTESIQYYCKIPIFGAIPKLKNDSSLIPGRHLGLVTPLEFTKDSTFKKTLANIANNYLDIDGLVKVAESNKLLDLQKGGPGINFPLKGEKHWKQSKKSHKVIIGCFQDIAFSFYYPENLEALAREGGKLISISSIEDKELPSIDALYIGGGFPETQAELITKNKTLLSSVKNLAEKKLPIYAECGGLIFLSRSITWNNNCYRMCGVFPIDLIINQKPVGHGYTIAKVDTVNPFFDVGTVIQGHEFHYSGLYSREKSSPAFKIKSCMSMEAGFGVGNLGLSSSRRDGLLYKNTLASYTHIHADGVKSWAVNFIRSALNYKNNK